MLFKQIKLAERIPSKSKHPSLITGFLLLIPISGHNAPNANYQSGKIASLHYIDDCNNKILWEYYAKYFTRYWVLFS